MGKFEGSNAQELGYMEITMRKSMINPTNWLLVLLAIFPGTLAVLQNYGIFVILPDTTPYWFLPLIVIFYAVILIVFHVVRRRPIAPWGFPVLGGLLWELWWLFSGSEVRRAPIMADLLLIILTIIGFTIIYKKRAAISTDVIVVTGIIIVSIGLLELFRNNKDLGFSTSVLISLLNLAIHTVPILTMGLSVAMKHGATAILLVAVYEPFLIEKYLGNNVYYDIGISRLQEVPFAMVAFQILPFLTFLILIPVLVLRSRSPEKQKWFLGIISFVVINCIAYILVFYLQDPDILFSLSPWAMWAHFVIVLWSPILLATLLYRNFPHIVPGS